MGIRETLNRNPKYSTIAAGVLTLGAICMAVWAMRGPNAGEGHKAWFTDDDGKTWFADDASRITPFDHNGKQAVMCFVYSCDEGKTQWVLYLMRYSAASKKAVEEQMAKANQRKEGGGTAAGGKPNLREMIGPPVMEVKKPLTGDTGWVRSDDVRAQAILELNCPHGPNSHHPIISIDPNE